MNGQLRASHLILSADLIYSTWQAFSYALLVDSPLPSYIDFRHVNFLQPSLTSPRDTTAEDCAPVRDESAERVSLNRRVHMPIEEPNALVQVAETNQDAAMVTRRKMTIDWFIPGT